ncbi:Methyltransferase domain-containing protein [Candidatus Nitrotoga sp. HW29]|uniref:class I SAM-dependent methyltransferase n=1 Tax=Candidatus Nitrotoga sp. HW29 TaxID=2886963 RepID=UPI001EF289E2|nr:class I SAM-dependent methyltransferase [Candidatus Nitrotoga sp. HW29]CAH1905776.1 Methyltransferase domain-containing protein [Candidatus Nitrotoga sp. HW29]
MNRQNPITETKTRVSISKYSKDEWIIVECSETGIVYLQNPPDYSRLVDELAWEKQFSEERARRKAREPVAFFISSAIKKLRSKLRKKERIETVSEKILKQLLANGKTSLNVLDVGCGIGEKLAKIANHMNSKQSVPIKSIGIEISQAQAAEANTHLKKIGGYCIHNSAIGGLKEISDNSIDVIILCSFLEHETSPLQLLKICKEKLDRHGKIVIKVPNFASFNRIVRQDKWCGFRYPDHVNYFTPKTLRLIVEHSGLKVDSLNALPTNDNMWAIVSA